MLRKIFKTGNSVVVSLPKDANEYLNMAEGTEVNVELDRDKRKIVITPAEPPMAIAGVDPEFSHQIMEFIEQYRPALEELTIWFRDYSQPSIEKLVPVRCWIDHLQFWDVPL